MQFFKKTLPGLLVAVCCQSYLIGQNPIDSLRSVIDRKDAADSTVIKTAVQLCAALVNTDSSFLIPEYAVKGLNIDTLNEDIQSKFKLYEYLGNYYWQVGKLSEAADQFNHMRLIGETYLDNTITANSYNGLGTVYYQISDFKMALEYYRKGLALSGPDSLLRARFYNNLANTFLMEERMDSVLIYYGYAINYHAGHKNYRQLSITYGNLALAFLKLNDFLKARKNLDLALEMAKKSEDPYQIASMYQLTGDIEAARNPDRAAESYRQALALARKTKSYSQIRKNLEALSYLAENMGNDKQALVYITEVKELADSINLEEKRTRIERLEYDHLAALRNADELEKKHESVLKEEQDRHRAKALLIILSTAFIALLLLLLMSIKTYRLRIRITRSKERFFSMIAHDIRNPFSGILGLSGILNEEAEKSEDPVYRKQVRSLHQSLNQVYDLLDNLLQWSQAETGKIAFNPQVQLLSPIVNEVISLHAPTGKQKGISLENQIQSGITARFDTNMLQTVLRNLLSNAIKFSRENSCIYISAEIHGKEVVMKVRDEGIGMDRERLNRLFLADERISTPGTQNETGTGLGLNLCKSFINRHGGRIWANSKSGEGTAVFFTLPDKS